MTKAKTASKSIISPLIDFWCVGGLSIIFMLALIMFYQFNGGASGSVDLQTILLMQVLINWPHFMASYRLLYAPQGSLKKHPFATLVVPGILVILIIYACSFNQASGFSVFNIDQTMSYYFWLIAAFYLAWHYTGQAWGMVATFTHLAGIVLTKQERFLLRFGLRVLLVWHVVWGAQDLPEAWLGPIFPYLAIILNYVSLIAFISFVMGIVGFLKIFNRTGIFPTKQMLAPWFAIYLWYLALSINPDAYIFVQMFHALQYLIFPVRVHLNEKINDKAKNNNNLNELMYIGKYYVLLVILGGVMFYAPDILVNDGQQQYTFALLIASAISIHHYFVDGCIWKISNPDVRKKLFAHVKK